MNTLKEVQSLLLPIWNKIYDKPECPKSFIKLMTFIIPRYKDSNFDGLLGKLKKRGVIASLRKTQIDLIEVNKLNNNLQRQLSELINGFENKEGYVSYDDIISESHSVNSDFALARRLIYQMIEDTAFIDFLKNKLKNKIVVDLGCGSIDDSVVHVLKFLGNLGIKKYFGVDKYLYGEHGYLTPEEFLKDCLKKEDVNLSFETKLIGKDILLFLRSLPNNYCNIICWNIGKELISGNEYRKQIEKEIIRVIPKGGLLITDCFSDLDEIYYHKYEKFLKLVRNFEKYDEKGLLKRGDWAMIYEKISY